MTNRTAQKLLYGMAALLRGLAQHSRSTSERSDAYGIYMAIHEEALQLERLATEIVDAD